MNCSIGLDLGTSAAKGVLFSKESGILAYASESFLFKDSCLENGAKYIGIDPEIYYVSICKVIKKLYDKMPDSARFLGLSMISASGNTLLCDRSGKPLIDAYSWTNPPMREEVSAVLGNVDKDMIADMAGWQFSDTFPLAHLSHLRINSPEILDNAEIVCMLTEFVNFRLTGKWGIDISSATPFYLYDQKNNRWNDIFCRKLGVDFKKLPPLKCCGDYLGAVTVEASKDSGLPEGSKVFLGSFDHPGAARANGVLKQGQLLLSCGTSWVCFFPYYDRNRIIRENLLCDPFLSPEGPWGGIFSLSKIGLKINEGIEKYISCKDNKFELFSELAERANANAGGLKIDFMKDTLPDLSGYSKENIALALMEGVAYALKERLDKLEKSGISFSSAVMAGGPSQSVIWRKILSSILGMEITVFFGPFSGAVGAAKYVLESFD